MNRASMAQGSLKKRGTQFVYKKKSTIGKVVQDPLQDIADDYELTLDEVKNLQKTFRRYDTQQINLIQWYEVDDIYRDMQIDITDSIRDLIVEQLKAYDQSAADLSLVAKIYAEIKKLQDREEEEAEQAETINAFVAMGGNYDRTGSVSKSLIIKIIKEEFQLDFDIESYLEKQGLGQNEELSYEDFYKIFEMSEEGKELLSTYSQNMNKKKGNKDLKTSNVTGEETEPGFEVNYKDFETWLKTQDQFNMNQSQQEQ